MLQYQVTCIHVAFSSEALLIFTILVCKIFSFFTVLTRIGMDSQQHVGELDVFDHPVPAG